jgi:hypothetical protein
MHVQVDEFSRHRYHFPCGAVEFGRQDVRSMATPTAHGLEQAIVFCIFTKNLCDNMPLAEPIMCVSPSMCEEEVCAEPDSFYHRPQGMPKNQRGTILGF